MNSVERMLKPLGGKRMSGVCEKCGRPFKGMKWDDRPLRTLCGKHQLEKEFTLTPEQRAKWLS
jgi:hypothetical protein